MPTPAFAPGLKPAEIWLTTGDAVGVIVVVRIPIALPEFVETEDEAELLVLKRELVDEELLLLTENVDSKLGAGA